MYIIVFEDICLRVWNGLVAMLPQTWVPIRLPCYLWNFKTQPIHFIRSFTIDSTNSVSSESTNKDDLWVLLTICLEWLLVPKRKVPFMITITRNYNAYRVFSGTFKFVTGHWVFLHKIQSNVNWNSCWPPPLCFCFFLTLLHAILCWES